MTLNLAKRDLGLSKVLAHAAARVPTVCSMFTHACTHAHGHTHTHTHTHTCLTFL